MLNRSSVDLILKLFRLHVDLILKLFQLACWFAIQSALHDDLLINLNLLHADLWERVRDHLGVDFQINLYPIYQFYFYFPFISSTSQCPQHSPLYAIIIGLDYHQYIQTVVDIMLSFTWFGQLSRCIWDVR